MNDITQLYKLIGKNLSKLRKEFKIGTQERLAENSELNLSFISQIEALGVGKGVSIETLHVISQKYKIDIRRFFDEYENLLIDKKER